MLDSSPMNDCDYDLYNGGISGVTESHGMTGEPTYAVNIDEQVVRVDLGTSSSNYQARYSFAPTVDPSIVGNFQLISSSKGYHKGAIIPNVNDDVAQPDVGAHQSGSPAMEFGVKAYGGVNYTAAWAYNDFVPSEKGIFNFTPVEMKSLFASFHTVMEKDKRN